MQKKASDTKKIDIAKNAPLILGIAVVVVLLFAAVLLFMQRVTEAFTSVSNNENVFSGTGAVPLENESAGQGTATQSVKDCLLNNGFNTSVYLYSPTCPHCQRMMPIVDALISEGYNITKVAASSGFAPLASCVNIRPVVPQFICNLNGQVLEGEVSEDKLREFYNNCKQ